MLSFIDKNSTRRELNDILPLKMPLGLCIEPTNLCNFQCVQCPVSLPEFKSVVGHRGNMDMELFKKILNDIKAMGKVINLNLYGDGEPLLNKNIVSMVNLIKEYDVAERITITTNASLLTEKISKGLIASGLTYLRVSIYSIYKERFKNITQSSTTPDDIYNNIKKFKEIRDKSGQKTPFLYVKMIDTYSKENEDFKKMYAPLVDQVNIETPMNWNGYNDYNLIEKIDPNRNTDETNIHAYFKQKGQSGLKKICTIAFHSLNIKLNGDVTICIVDWNKGTKVGNIKEKSLSDIWFGEDLKKFREIHIKGLRESNVSCKNCNFLYNNPDNIDDLSPERYKEILNYKG